MSVACQPPQSTLMFFPGTPGPEGPKGDVGDVGPRGDPGPAGPLSVYVGTYAGSGRYYDNTVRRDIVDYNGAYWIANNTAKNDTATWGLPTGTDWLPFGVALVSVATEIRLNVAANIDVGLNIRPPGYLKSDNFVQYTSGTLISGAGRLESYDALIAGQVSTDSPRFNLENVNRTMPAVATATIEVPQIVAGDMPVNPDIAYVTDNALIFFGWNRGANSYLPNRFGNSLQVFDVMLQGWGSNTSAGTDQFYIQLYYRRRIAGGPWDVAWSKLGHDAYMNKLAALNQSFQLSHTLTISITGDHDIQFAAGFSVGGAGTAAVEGGQISVKAFN